MLGSRARGLLEIRVPSVARVRCRAPTAVRQRGRFGVCPEKHSQVFGSCIYIFILTVKHHSYIYISNAGRSLQLFLRSAVARFHGFTGYILATVSYRSQRPTSNPWLACARYIALSPVRRVPRRRSLPSHATQMPVWS